MAIFELPCYSFASPIKFLLLLYGYGTSLGLTWELVGNYYVCVGKWNRLCDDGCDKIIVKEIGGYARCVENEKCSYALQYYSITVFENGIFTSLNAIMLSLR